LAALEKKKTKELKRA